MPSHGRHVVVAIIAGAIAACAPPTSPGDDTAREASASWPEGVWNPGLPDAVGLRAPEGARWVRAVFHLHSPWSHDACDGRGLVEGVPRADCLADLHDGLCRAGYDVAFLTDHPDHADQAPFEALTDPDAEAVAPVEGVPGAAALSCVGSPRRVLLRAGFEDELMPVGLRRHVHDDPDTRHALLNSTAPEAFAAMTSAGARVLLAHTELRQRDDLLRWQTTGLHGVEVFNLHAAFAPTIRRDALGLDHLGWTEAATPFTHPEGSGEPDLLFLAVHGEQAPSVAHLDALLAEGPMMITAGTDAHQNVLPGALRDGERGDGFRRMLRWMSTLLLVDPVAYAADSVGAVDAAVAERRSAVVFEALGTPDGLWLRAEDGAAGVAEMGGELAGAGPFTLDVGCPTLADGSPRGPVDPEVTVTVFRDGAPWHVGCGRVEAPAGAYRVRVDIVPHHLTPFLGDDPTPYLASWPWAYTGAVRLGGP
jgi:hypothetical protein